VSVSDAAAKPPAEVLLVGCGKMGGALLEGWLERGVAPGFAVVEPGAGAQKLAPRPEVML
jgi:pyrroline-5-carboxylate reductase